MQHPPSVNPYHPASELSPDADLEDTSELRFINLDRPITFGGKVDAGDVKIWVPELTSRTILHLVWIAFWIMFFAGMLIAGVVYALRSGIHIWPIAYFVIGLLALESFGRATTSIAAWWTRNDIRRNLDLSSSCRGFIDANGVCWQSKHHTVCFNWGASHYGYTVDEAVIFGIDENPYVLPKRFFQSPKDFYDLKLALYEVNYPNYKANFSQSDFDPNDFGSDHPMTLDQVAEAKQWNADNWAIGDNPASRVEVDYYTTDQDFDSGYVRRTKKRYLVSFLVLNAPVLITLPIWLLIDRIHYGAWNFVLSEPSSWIFLVALGLFLFRQGKESLAVFAAQLRHDAVRLVFSNTGFLTITSDDYLYWTNYLPEMKFFADEMYIGWDVPNEPERKLRIRRDTIGAESADRIESLLRENLFQPIT